MSSSISTSSPTPPLVHPVRPRLEAFGLTHPGFVRELNEDAYLVAHDAGLFVVADGVGGEAAGEVASHLAIDTLREHVGDRYMPGVTGLEALVAGFELANTRIRDAGRADGARAGMATTLTALLVQHARAALAHVGDSRIYRVQGRHLEQLTEDHSVVGACVQAGLMTREEAAASPIRHVIRRAVGADDRVDVDGRLVLVEPGDTLLLCSDGLHGVVEDEEMGAILLAEPDPAHAAELLIKTANDRGGPDNVTVVLVRVG